jgi:hypothetical protein
MEVLRPGAHEEVGPLKQQKQAEQVEPEAAAPAGVDEPEEIEEPLPEHPPVRFVANRAPRLP